MASVWDSVFGQDRAVEQLRLATVHPVHAFLLVGPDGCGKDEAARAFAGVLLSGNDDPGDRINELAMAGRHPDIHEVRREGASILMEQAEDVVQEAMLTPTEGLKKAIIMHEVNLMAPGAAAALLKTVEEPAEGVFMILLADAMVDTLVTIASRCMTINFALMEPAAIEKRLVHEGVRAEVARAASVAAHGSLAQARFLATDPQLVQRREFFANIPRRIDGTGATVIAIVEQILTMIDDAAEPMRQRHEQEVAEREKNLALMGVKRSAKKQFEDHHKRELRRHRTDELRGGLAEIAGVYRNELSRPDRIHRPEAYVAAIDHIHSAMRRLALNVNESILLRDLIWSLPSPSADAALQFVLAE